MTEKQAAYLNDLIQTEMLNVTRSIPGSRPGTDDSRKFADFFAGKLRDMTKDADAAKGSEMIDAVKQWAAGPQAVIALVNADRNELAAYLGM